MQHQGTIWRVVPADAGHEHVAHLAPARRQLAGTHSVAAVDLGGAAVRPDPVRCAGADQDGPIVDDLAEDLLCVHAVEMPPHLGGNDVGVHREGDGRRRVMGTQRPQDLSHGGVGRSSSTEVAGYERGRHPRLPEELERLGIDLSGAVAFVDLRSKRCADLLGAGGPVRGRGSGLWVIEAGHGSTVRAGTVRAQSKEWTR